MKLLKINQLYTVLLLLISFASFAGGSGQDLVFLENKGQWPAQVQFKSQLGNNRLWVTRNRLTFEIINGDLHPMNQLHKKLHQESPSKSTVAAHIYEVYFRNAAPLVAKPEGQPTGTRYNFYQDSDPGKWASGVLAYPKLGIQQIYPGVSLTLYGDKGHLKYDFELAAGQTGSNIAMEYVATNGVEIRNGHLRIKTALGTIEEHIPRAYQLVEGVAKPVECRFTCKGNVVGFEFAKKPDPRYATIIDPVLNFFTYSGALSDNWANTAVSDAMGNSYTAGTIYGSGFPVTTGVVDRTYNSGFVEMYLGYDVGILKFNASGSQLLWCTFLGGSAAETPHALEIDERQNLVVMGTTSSPNFPTSTTAYDRTFNGGTSERPFGSESGFILPTYLNGSDIFISKIRSDGTALLASTFLGGSNSDGLMTISDLLVTNYGDQFRGDVSIDQLGNIYLASHTKSSNFPVKNAASSQLRGVMDGVVCKLSQNLDQLIWSTFWGGDDNDVLLSVNLTENGKVAVCGGTQSSNYPTPVFAYQPQRTGNSLDGVLSIFNAVTGQNEAGTYTSTAGYDQAYLVSSDKQNNIYIFGQTQGVMPKSANVYGQARGGQFIQKFNSNLSTLLWGTTYGTTVQQPNIAPTAFLIDSCNRIYMSGWGGRVNYRGPGFAGGPTIGLPVTSDAFRTTTSDSSDFYFLVLSSDARDIVFGSYFGASVGRGEHVDGGTSHFDRQGVITQAVCGCTDFNDQYLRGTPLSYSPNINSGNCNNGVLKINLLDLTADFGFNGEVQCPATLTLTNQSQNGVTYTWFFGNGDSLVSNNANIQYKYDSPGTYIITLKSENPKTCRMVAFAYDTIVIPDPFPFVPRADTGEYCVGDTLIPVFAELENYAVTWKPATYVSNPTIYNPLILPLSSVKYQIQVKDEAGCITRFSYQTKNREIDLGFGYDKIFDPCVGTYTIRYFSNRDSSDQYIWYFDSADSATGAEVTRQYNQNGRYLVRLNGSKFSCYENAIDTIVLNDQKISILPDFEAIRKYDGCAQPSYIFKNKTGNATAYTWDFGDGFKSTDTEPEHRFEPGTYIVKLQGFQHSCEEEVSKPLVVDELRIPNLVTQNGDGKNEAFQIGGLQSGWGLEVYNRWGKKVYGSSNYQNDWIPEKIQEGLYFFNLLLPDGNHCNGWVDIMK